MKLRIIEKYAILLLFINYGKRQVFRTINPSGKTESCQDIYYKIIKRALQF